MKFRFCGDGDCPDWVLAAIHSTLSDIPAVKLKILTQMMVKSVLGEHIPDEKFKETFTIPNNESSNVGTNKPDINSLKSAIACLRYLVLNAVRYNTDEHTFSAELQQLGLQKDHANIICKVNTENTGPLKKHLQETSLTINKLNSITYTIPNDTIDTALFSFDIANEIIDGTPVNRTHKINISKTDMAQLLHEMKLAYHLMEEYDYEKKYSVLND